MVTGKQEYPQMEAEAFCVAYGTYRDYNGMSDMRVLEKVILPFEVGHM